MTTRILVLGTGTHVGKTHVACALARALHVQGRRVRALKPIESGYVAARSDAAALAHAAGHAVAPPLYPLADAISPHLAARRAGAVLELARIQVWLDQHTDATLHYVIIESAGGAFTPVTDRTTNADLAAALAPARLLLVAPDRLGVLHDLTACLQALAARGLTADHVVLSQVPPGDASTGTNADELARLGITPVAAVIGSTPTSPTVLLDALGLD